ncbi:short-chain dehydrogenase/reductase [Thozetella sp. PMI_491]|nr:short-chain dehydrogenase/reductase [Thozetella sp. PMI_491]
MSVVAKTVVATGASSGLGFEAIKQLLGQSQAYKFILGARDTKTTETAFNDLKYDVTKHTLTVLPLELSNLKSVQSFAQQTLQKLGADKIDYLMLGAAQTGNAEGPGPFGSKWSAQYVVNHLSQHYLLHLLREKLVESKARIVVVSSGVIRNADEKSLDRDVRAESGTQSFPLYSQTKFAQLLGAHWWRRQLDGSCKVVAVSPGLIPGTGLGRGTGAPPPVMNHPDAKSIPEGGASILAAFTRDDFPEDPEEIFLTSWGEWWSKDVYGNSLDKELQDKWSPSKEDIEKEEGLSA